MLKLPLPQRFVQIDSFFVEGDNDTSFISRITQCQKLAAKAGDEDTRIFMGVRKFIIYKNTGSSYPFLSHLIDSLAELTNPRTNPYVTTSIEIQRAWLHQANKDHIQAFESFLRTYALLQTMSTTDFHNKDYCLYSIADAFYQFRDLSRSIEIARKVSDQPKLTWIKTYNSTLLGLCYLKREQYDSARYWFLDAEKTVYLPDNINIGWQGLLRGNIGNTWYRQGQYEKAIPLFQEAIQKAKETEWWDVAGGFACYLAEIYVQQGTTPQAYALLSEAQSNIMKVGGDENLMHLHDALTKYYRKVGNAERTLFHLDSMLYHKAIMDKDLDARLKVQAEFNYEHEKRLSRERFLEAETKRQRVTRNLIICILFLLLAFGILYYKRQRMKDRYTRQILQEEKRVATEELDNARVQLDDFTRSLKEKNILIERFTDELQKLQVSPNHSIPAEQMEIFEQLRISAILTDADWEEFRVRFEKVHSGFLQRLRSRIPDLSPAETRFMALAKLQLNNKEMASILGISPDSIRTIRYRLRKKLHLAEEGSMDELVNSI